jgi:adenylate kinase
MNIIVLGPQGSGKGTQGKKISQTYGIPHIATGDELRKMKELPTPTGIMIKEVMDRGGLVEDELLIRMIRDRLDRGDTLPGFVLDGFPRTLPQAEKLEDVLDGHPLDLVINLDVPTEIVLDRIAGRRVCEKCGTTYHVNAPPKSDWTCDVCGGRVVQREDDTEDAVLRRLELYAEETVPIIDFYRKVGKLVVVDGTGDGDDVFARLVTQVDQRLKPLQT